MTLLIWSFSKKRLNVAKCPKIHSFDGLYNLYASYPFKISRYATDHNMFKYIGMSVFAK